MDIISVTHEALAFVRIAILELRDMFDNETKKRVASINDLLPRIDDSFQPKIVTFIEMIEQFNRDVTYCLEEHNTAINDRLNRLPEYEGRKYIKR